jgi:hypothetical protein
MARKAEHDLRKHTLNLFAGDVEKIQNFFPEIGASVIIRKIVHEFVERVEAEVEGTKVSVKVTL